MIAIVSRLMNWKTAINPIPTLSRDVIEKPQQQENKMWIYSSYRKTIYTHVSVDIQSPGDG